jgi:hypothetical protein
MEVRMAVHDSAGLGGIVHGITQGLPYVFVIMSYESDFTLFQRVREVVKQSVGLSCIRADEVPGSGNDLRAKVHLLIDRAELVIANLGDPSPNVFYEIGYSVGAKKPLLMLLRRGNNIPTDLKGLEFIEYAGSRDGMETFQNRLSEHLRVRVGSQVALLRDMLEASIPRPAFILASPKYPTSTTGHPPDERTYGDNLGIKGLITAFAAISGEDSGIELASAQYCPPGLLKRPNSLYLIGAPDVNPATGEMLRRIQEGKASPQWVLDHEGDDTGSVSLRRSEGGKTVVLAGERVDLGSRVFDSMDYGILIRAPHPDYRQDRIVLIMAGAKSLGTGAACLAATRSPLVRQIKIALESLTVAIDLADKHQAFWALVKGQANERDWLLDVEGVKLIEVGAFR